MAIEKIEEMEERLSRDDIPYWVLKKDALNLLSEVKKWKTGCKDLAEDMDKLEEEVERLQDHANNMGEIISNQTKIRLEREAMIKELEEEVKRLKSLWDRYRASDPKCNSVEYMVSVEQANERLEAEVEKFKPGYYMMESVRIGMLEEEVKRLRNGIEKHRGIKQDLVNKYNYNADPKNNILLTLDDCDEELYKLLEGKDE